jgi:hypothetical protein
MPDWSRPGSTPEGNMMTWLRRLREWFAASQAIEDQKRWDAEQVRRRESLASQREWDELQTVRKGDDHATQVSKAI